MALAPYVKTQRTLNEQVTAAEIIRQVLLLRFSLHVRDLVVRALNDTERPIAAMVRESLFVEAGLRNPAQVRELDRLIADLNRMRAQAWQLGTDAAEAEVAAAGDAEVEDQRDLFAAWLPGINLLPVSLGVGVAALARAFQGRTFRQWMADAREAESRRMREALYAGVGAGEDADSVVRRLFGSRRAKGRDGSTQTSRNHVNTIVRSGLVHVTTYSRDQFFRANAASLYFQELVFAALPINRAGGVEDAAVLEARRQAQQALSAARARTKVFVSEQYVAVLDDRTTNLCRGLDGRRYPVGEGPIPPLHHGCRSMRVLVLPPGLGGPTYDPGRYASWIRQQPDAVREAFTGSRRDAPLNQEELAETLFGDYGARAMTLAETRAELRRLLKTY